VRLLVARATGTGTGRARDFDADGGVHEAAAVHVGDGVLGVARVVVLEEAEA